MKKLLAVLTFSLLPVWAQAESTPTYDRIAFDVSAEVEVENDTTIATLYSRAEGQDVNAISAKVNEAIAWALAEAKKVDTVESRTLNYTTHPSYDNKGRISGWQVRQSIRLKSTNAKDLSNLLGTLQEKVSIESVKYALSRSVQRKIEDQLIGDALANFKRRATQVKENMGRDEYRVVKLKVRSANDYGAPQPYLMEAAPMMRAAKAAPAPVLSAGKQTLRVNVSAEIELSLN